MSKVDQKIVSKKHVREDMYEEHKTRGFNRKERREQKRTWFEGDEPSTLRTPVTHLEQVHA